LQLEFLHLSNFKNWINQDINLSCRIVCLSGNNGMGKTNFLDAIYYLCTGKSYFQSQDMLNINHEADFFRIQGNFIRNHSKESIVCTYRKGNRKQLKRNDVLYKRLAEHSGIFPVVEIAPDDMIIINGHSAERRRFINFMLSNADRNYLNQLLLYQRVLKHRNAYLKDKLISHLPVDETLLDSYDEQLLHSGIFIFEKRKKAIKVLESMLMKVHGNITDSNSPIALTLDSQLEQHPFSHLLKNCRAEDIRLGRSTSGIHKDDILIFLDGYELKKFASQGQKKSILIALKMAQLSFLEQYTKQAPLLLLDDLFDKLDRQRGERLLNYVCRKLKSQVFITDTHTSRISEIVQSIGLPLQLLGIENGKISNSEIIE